MNLSLALAAASVALRDADDGVASRACSATEEGTDPGEAVGSAVDERAEEGRVLTGQLSRVAEELLPVSVVLREVGESAHGVDALPAALARVVALHRGEPIDLRCGVNKT